MKKYNYLFLVFLFLLTACSGEHAGTCIPSDNNNSGASSDISSIDKFMMEKKPVSSTINKVKEKLYGNGGSNGGSAKKLFESFINSSEYRSGVGAAFTLVVLFYGLGISTGMLQLNGGDATIRLAKLGFVTAMALSWDNFYGIIGNTFAGGRDELIGYMLESFKDSYQNMGGTAPTTNQYLFEDLDRFIAQIFSMHMFAILSALFSAMGENSGPYALGYALFLLTGIIFLFQSIMVIIQSYVFSLFANVILFAFAPIFLVFMLFEKTKHLFDGWLKQTISYNLQPVALVAFLGLFIVMLQPFLEEILSLKVCYLSSDATSGNTWQFVDATTNSTLHFGVNSAPPIELKTLLMFFFFSWLFNGYLLVANQIVTAITATISTTLSNINIPYMNAVTGGKGNFGQLFGMK